MLIYFKNLIKGSTDFALMVVVADICSLLGRLFVSF